MTTKEYWAVYLFGVAVGSIVWIPYHKLKEKIAIGQAYDRGRLYAYLDCAGKCLEQLSKIESEESKDNPEKTEAE